MTEEANSTPVISLAFRVVGEFDPLELSEYVGLEADSEQRKGDSIGNASSLYVLKHNYWSIEGGEVQAWYLGEEMARLVSRVIPYKDRLVAYCREHDLKPSIMGSIFISGDNTPSLDLSNELLSRIVSLDADIDISLYVGP
jgi:hypothetical protein